MTARRARPFRFGGTVVVVALWSLVGLTGCGATSGSGVSTTSSAAPQPSGTPTATFPSTTNPVTIDAGTYRIPKSEWSVADFRVTFPKGWTVQYGHDYLKHPDAPDEFGFYAVAPDAIYDDACKGRGELEKVGPSADDLATALLGQPGPEVSGPVHTSLGGYPAIRIDLAVPHGLDPKMCRLEGAGLQIWYSPPADKYFVLLPDGKASAYIVDVDGQRQVFLTQYRSKTSHDDLQELKTILDSIQIEA